MFSKINLNWKFIFSGILVLFRCFGLFPVKSDSNQKKPSKIFNWILIAWSLINLVFVGVLIYFTVKRFMNDDSDLVNFNNILTFSIVALTQFVVLIESLLARNNFLKIWNNVCAADDLIEKMIDGYDEVLNKFYKRICIKIISYLIATFVLEALIIFNVKGDASWTFMWSVCIIPLTVSRLRHLQFAIYIDILACRFQVIKKELKTIVMLTKVQSNELLEKNSSFIEALFIKINGIKKIYYTLWEISLLINRTFGFSQISNFLQNFVQLTCDLYVMYSFLYLNDLTYIFGEQSINSHLFKNN